MAGVFVDPAVQSLEGVFTAPRRVPGVGVFQLEAVEDLAGGYAGKPLGHLEGLPRAHELLNLGNVGGLDHQGIALVAADGIAHPVAHRVGAVAGVQPDDPRVVDHLDVDHHRIRRLDDLVIVVVVAVRQHRRAVVAAEPGDAALAERAVLIAVIDVPVVGEPTHLRCAGFAGRRQAVGRGEDRGAVRAVDLHQLGAWVDPEGVVAAGVAAGGDEVRPDLNELGGKVAGLAGLGRGGGIGRRVGVCQRLGPDLLETLGLIRAQRRLFRDARIAGQRGQGGVAPVAGEVRLAHSVAGRFPGRGRWRLLRRRGDCKSSRAKGGSEGENDSAAHCETLQLMWFRGLPA